jgi:hypothetical protein
VTPDQWTALAADIASAPDLREGNCVGRWSLFDQADNPLAVEQATELCLGVPDAQPPCSVLDECRAWSRQLNNREVCGILAGKARPWSPRSCVSPAQAGATSAFQNGNAINAKNGN